MIAEDGVSYDHEAPVGAIVAAEVDGRAVAVIHTDGGWVLVEDACPHANCPFTLDGELADGTTLICNCHGSEFDLRTGAVLLGPATSGLTVTRLASVREDRPN